MLDIDAEIGESLTGFFTPQLADLRPEIVAQWNKAFSDPQLREGILGNARLEQRVVADIMRDVPDVEVSDIVGSLDEEVIKMLLGGRQTQLVQALGMAHNRATILNWVTWNELKTQLPEASAQFAHAVIAAVPQNDQNTEIEIDLTFEDVEDDGIAYLSAWAGELPADLRARLDYFVDIDPTQGSPDISARVRMIAQAVIRLEED